MALYRIVGFTGPFEMLEYFCLAAVLRDRGRDSAIPSGAWVRVRSELDTAAKADTLTHC
jgi:hypothetical protein